MTDLNDFIDQTHRDAVEAQQEIRDEYQAARIKLGLPWKELREQAQGTAQRG